MFARDHRTMELNSNNNDARAPETCSSSSSSVNNKPKGDLIFEANFESGNIGSATPVSEFYEYDITIRPDTNNPSHRLWFYFNVRNVQRNQRVLFNIVNFSKTKSLYRLGMSPLVRSTSRPQWERVPEKQVFYYRSPRHKRSYVLSFAFVFDREADVYSFAYSYPYTYTDLQQFLHFIEEKELPFFKRELLCRTLLHRRLDLLTITAPQNLEPENMRRKKMVFITARVHPGESPASYVAHGLITFLLSDHPSAQLLRENLIFKIVPMLNPDGVFLGNYRCSTLGHDLNRNWLNPSAWAHPTIKATRDLLIQLNEKQNADLDFFIDIHAHSSGTNGFMYVNCPAACSSFSPQMVFPRLLDNRCREFSVASTRYSSSVAPTTKMGTGRRALEALSLAPYCYTLEVSFYCHTDNKMKPVPFTQESYMGMGRDLALTFLDFYKINNSKTPPPPPPPPPPPQSPLSSTATDSSCSSENNNNNNNNKQHGEQQQQQRQRRCHPIIMANPAFKGTDGIVVLAPPSRTRRKPSTTTTTTTTTAENKNTTNASS